ncbi:MAG: hypothetical protein LBF62_13500 [Tannerellaceae bacterium]|jgi:mannosyltransferase OCH1-like enzyme|nr:hypothetical protein [Tannerellaceae bacterium]
MNKIPPIIHQVWSDKIRPLPSFFKELSETWKERYPDWEYILWDDQKMDAFITNYYPEFYSYYLSFPYDVQRWDTIRYLFLYKMGGMYVDFDYEAIEPLYDILEKYSCCFASEPKEHALLFEKDIYVNNGLIITEPNHPFMKCIIDCVMEKYHTNICYSDKMKEVLLTTGPLMITNLFENYENKNDIYIMPPEIVAPLNKIEVADYINSENLSTEVRTFLEKKLIKAKAVHYFVGSWY